MYRLSHREKALILGASRELHTGSVRVGREAGAGPVSNIGNGNCVQEASPAEKNVMEDAEVCIPVLSEPPQSGQKE